MLATLSRRFLPTTTQNLLKTIAISSRFQQYSNGAYEGDGKTTVTVLNKEYDSGLMVDTFSQYGFRLNNDLVVMGPMAIFPK